MAKNKPALYNRIIFWIAIPILLTTVIISSLLVTALSPPIDAFLKNQFEANLRLASAMGLQICQNNFDYLLELRLEDNSEMNLALQNEVLEEIKAVSRQIPQVHLMVFNEMRKIQAWSLPSPEDQHQFPNIDIKNDRIVRLEIDGQPALAHVVFFPFWKWYIASFVYEKDYLSPVRASHNIIYLSMLGVFASVFITLLVAYSIFVNKPLQRLIDATKDVSEGKYQRVRKSANNELGQLTGAFNAMIANLESEKSEVRNLINQLQISESQLRTFFENIPLGICIVNENGEILRTNPGMQTIAGYSEEQLLGSGFCQLFEKRDICHQLLADLDTFNAPEEFETGLKQNDTLYFLRILLTTISLDDHRLVFAVLENVTEQKKLESQLIQARKMEAIGSLAGGVAHDFNNLLTPIIGYSEMLLEDMEGKNRGSEELQSILNAANKARGIVHQLLAFSRKQTLEVKTVDLNEIITGFLGLLQRTIREDIRIRYELTPALPHINVDTGQIEQVIMNLAVNSQDAMPQGGELTIETNTLLLDTTYTHSHASVIPGRYAMMAISDTGHGMDSATQERIFDPFFTTKVSGRGTGFGLATVYGIVKQHNGYIWVYSEPGRGSTFKVYFPTAENVIEEEEEIEVNAVIQNKTKPTILIVEDDLNVLEMAASILRKHNYNVLTAANGIDALDLVGEHEEHIDLLLTDVIMPGMNGRQLYEQIARNKGGVKVIFMSGYTDNVIAHHGILDHGVVFLQKPFSIKTLVGKVKQALMES